MKSSYPKTYDYIYQLVQDGIDIDFLKPINERCIAANILEDTRELDLSETFFVDRYTAHKISDFLFTASLEATIKFQDEVIKNVMKHNKITIQDIFESAEKEWNEESGKINKEMDDWRNQDDRSRTECFKTHHYY